MPSLQDAVALALTFDRAIASAVATRAEDDEALQRKLWLAIARHLIDVASENSDSDPVLIHPRPAHPCCLFASCQQRYRKTLPVL